MKRAFHLILSGLLILAACEKLPTASEDPFVPITPTPQPQPVPDPPLDPASDSKTISVLAVGNSFSIDAMEYLYSILKETGAEQIALGNLYISGCSLDTHAAHFTANEAAYTYYTNTEGSWTSTASVAPLTALKEREWDYITLQQVSGDSGVPESYTPALGTLKEIIKKECPDAKLAWHMTWAYQGNSTHGSFHKYGGSDQMAMYNAILGATQDKIATDKDFELIIPAGTAVQNLRTSHFGDRITRDGYHLSYKEGRFVVALTWAKALRKYSSLKDIHFRPSGYEYEDRDIAAIKEAAENAVKSPFKVTASSYPPQPGDEVITSDDLTEILRLSGHDPARYTALELNVTRYAYYNSSNATYLSKMYTQENSTASNLKKFVCTQIFPKSEIPVGSVIVLKDGYQYRPEGWVTLTTKNSSSDRPAEVSDQVVEVTESWWGPWNYRAFNIARSGKPDLSEADAGEAAKSLGIFIPKP